MPDAKSREQLLQDLIEKRVAEKQIDRARLHKDKHTELYWKDQLEMIRGQIDENLKKLRETIEEAQNNQNN